MNLEDTAFCGGAHEIGILECLDMLELQGKELPNATVIGIVPQEIDLQVGLSAPLKEHFDDYIKTVISAITELGFKKVGIDSKKRVWC
jgi:hydrogenase maturation protease